ncbi:hypothetical protein [Trichoplusia ni ascovirus 2c]|uniref:hypothetical protein n=1 Tax=Trichoplusia ni ascovirus 2c TaxID=328615 RepID=UPI0000E44228|nr:hypothetical protein TNAV2c_gp080 [Trichoplusia ni ascovirus 2c]ABF70597.1 hypothetical protein [Trichoplusia ni ascovirus 2c]AUS94185.1 hypothetical protein [Trichoplusia ni ascovirus 6b]
MTTNYFWHYSCEPYLDMFMIDMIIFMYFLCNFLTMLLFFTGDIKSPRACVGTLTRQILFGIVLLLFGSILAILFLILQLWYLVIFSLPITKCLSDTQIAECPVCMNKLSIFFQMVSLKCSHKLCRKCYRNIVGNINGLCPLCRANIDTRCNVLVY